MSDSIYLGGLFSRFMFVGCLDGGGGGGSGGEGGGASRSLVYCTVTVCIYGAILYRGAVGQICWILMIILKITQTHG